MALPESPTPKELPPLPAGIEAVEEMSDLHNTLTEFGFQVASVLKKKLLDPNEKNFCLLVPLQGALVPILYVLEQVRSLGPDLYDELLKRLEFVTTTKEGEEATAEVVLASEVETDDETTYFGIEDIVDDGGTIKALAKLYGGHAIELHAAFHKPGSVEKAEEKVKEIEPNTTIRAYHEIPDKWVFGAGMDGGSTRLNGKNNVENAVLAVLQRLSTQGYAYSEDRNPDYKKLCDFLEQSQLPISDRITGYMTSMEIAKMNNDHRLLRQICGYILLLLQENTKPIIDS